MDDVVPTTLVLGIPWTQALFQVGDLPLDDCVLALGLGLIPVSMLELAKLVPWNSTSEHGA